MRSKTKEKVAVRKLRRQGLSLRQINKAVPVSKSSISLWCKDIVLSDSKKEMLTDKQKQGRLLAIKQAAISKSIKRINNEAEYSNLGMTQIGSLSERERFLIGVSLYFAEGSKTGSGVEFTNSDPASVKFMINWFEEYCEISRREIKCSLWLHENLSESDAIQYWTSHLNVLAEQFGKTYFAKNKINSPKIRHNYHSYGIIKIRFYDTNRLRLIKGWIKGIFSQ